MSQLKPFKWIVCILFWIIAFPNHPLHAQHGSSRQDTLSFHKLNARFQKEVGQRGHLNLDTLKYFGHSAIKKGKSIHNTKGLINIYLGFGSGYIDKVVRDSSKFYYSLALEEAISARDTNLIGNAYLGYGWTLIYGTHYDSAVHYSMLAYDLAKATNDTSLLITVLNKLPRIHFLKNDLLKAYELSRELIQVGEIHHDTISLAYGYWMLGTIYSSLNMYDKQMNIVHNLLKISNSIKDTLALYRIQYTASNGYLKQQKYDSVLYYSRLNLPLSKKLGVEQIVWGNIARAYLEMNQLDSAGHYYQKIMDDNKKFGTYIDTYLYLDLGKIEFQTGNHTKALAYFQIAESEISKPTLSTQKEIYHALYSYYKVHDDPKKALYYHEKYKTITDSILNYNIGISVLEYESEKLEDDILLLTKDKELQATVFAKERQQRNISYAAISVLMLLTGLSFVRYRNNKIRKSKQALMKERLRLSRDLHDEVGATLSGIAMYSHVAREQVKHSKPVEADESLSIMQSSAGDMVNKLSDIVWLMNPEQDTLSKFIERLEEYARKMASARNMQVSIILPRGMESIQMPFEARRNIYLVCKEAINNAVKYSNGGYIRLQVKIIDDKILFTVQDDGKGFDEITIRRGNGLENMKRRAEEIGATFSISSEKNQGVNIELQYKLTQ